MESVTDFTEMESVTIRKKKTNAPCENVIMRISTFRYRTMSSRRRVNLKNNIRLNSDLMKKSFEMFNGQIETVKSYDNVNYIIVGINCLFKWVFTDNISLRGTYQLIFWCLCIIVALRFEQWLFLFVILCISLFDISCNHILINKSKSQKFLYKTHNY